MTGKNLATTCRTRRLRAAQGALVALLLALLLPASPLRAQVNAPVPTGSGMANSGETTETVKPVPEKKELQEDENEAYRHSPTVVKLGALLGMKPETAATAFTLFNFLVLLAGVGYLLAKNLPKAFRARNTAIQKGLVDARTATEEASARLQVVESRLASLDEQIAAMRSQAEADSAREEQRLKAGAEEEKQKIIAAAEAEITAAAVTARRQLQQYAAELAIDQAARKLVVSAETDRLLVESFAERLGTGHGSEN